MKPLLITFFAIMVPISLWAQEPVFLNDFSTQGRDAFLFDPEIEGYTLNNQLYFLVDDGQHGEELWRTNGTTVGTQLIKDIYPGDNTSSVRILGSTGDILLFAANDGENGYELWVTQGTASSTQLIDISPGPTSSSPNSAAVLNDVLYFSAYGEDGRELYRSQGTPGTTSQVRDINPDTLSSGTPHSGSPNDLITVGNWVYFVANDGEHGNELWITNGTSEFTAMVKDIHEGATSADFHSFKAGSNKLYFMVDDGIHGRELWISDGSFEGTKMLKDITEGSDGSNITLMEEVNGVFYFIVHESVVERNLWKTDGTEEGTAMVGDGISTRQFYLHNDTLYFRGNSGIWKADGETEEQITDVSVSLNGEFASVGDWLYFVASEGASGNGLWKTDGSLGSEELVKEITTASYKEIEYLIGVGDHVYFIAEDDTFGNEIWTSDGTAEGTFMILDGAPGPEDGFRTYEDVSYGVIGDMLLFAGTDHEHGRELWRSQGTVESTELVKNINAGTTDMQLSGGPVAFEGYTYFLADSGLWRSDGTAEGTVLVRHADLAGGLHVMEDNMLFSASAPDISRTIWTSDGTSDGTQPLFDTSNVPATIMLFQNNLPQKNGELFFMANSSGFGYEPWKTDGTVEGTMMVKDIYEGSESSLTGFPDSYVFLGDILYFKAADADLGQELWRTDGTAEGTEPVTDINPSGSSAIRHLIEMNGMIYFFADDGTAGHELWKSDGTTEGTVMVKEIYPGEDDGVYSFSTYAPVVFNDMLYFTGVTGEHGRELWRSDGTAEGTEMVKDIHTEGNGSPRYYYVSGNTLYLEATDTAGARIWKSDGTAEGTVPYIDMDPLYNMLDVDGMLFFTATDDETGYELWRIAPESGEPLLVADIMSGPSSANSRIEGYYNGSLYFTARDPLHGRELWTLTPFEPLAAIDVITEGICNPEDTAVFITTVMDAGEGPVYEWYINGDIVDDANGDTLVWTGFTDGDQVQMLTIAANDQWLTEDSVFSEIITMNYATPVAEITVSGNTLTASEGTAYQWFRDDALLPDATQSIAIAESGTYRVEVSNAAGCTSLSDPIAVVVNPTGIENESVAGPVKPYPNPVSTHLYVEANLNAETKLRIYNTTGKMLYEDLLPAGEIHATIPMQQFPSGVYLVLLIGESGTLTHTIMKD